MDKEKEQLNSENFSQGLSGVEIPELGSKIEGKVRDNWIVDDERIMVTTDRLSAYDRLICTIPKKGQVLNQLSGFWFEKTKSIIPNHLVATPHPNVMIAKQAEVTIPIEVVFRRYMAKSATSTSIYHNYFDQGRRFIYGIEFPKGLIPNCEFPIGTILTPTTKASFGHDLELTEAEAQEIADNVGSNGIWDQIKAKGKQLFDFAYDYHLNCGLILADTKFEFGLDSCGRLMLIDELFTPDSSRLWKADSYKKRIAQGFEPEIFDKDIVRKYLADKGFTGEGEIPTIPLEIINQTSLAYQVPYQMITRQKLESANSLERVIIDSIYRYLNS